MINRIITRFMLLGCLLITSVNSYAELVVIVHPDNTLQAINVDELKRIYLGKMKEFPNGLTIGAIDPKKESEERTRFYKIVVGKSLAQVSSYWSRLIFTGKGVPPRVIDSDEKIKEWVSSHPESIGYIDSRFVDEKVKAIYRIK